ncbi:GGDEF domain-containing protein [Paenibacillus thermotolerans]|uniref:GGDEF domain-containing protein n=1 Tax=Paenibacillus thermotolerans TaxID=3027807 RepID=UPI0023681376|nr:MULTISPECIES: GGDEF domain-containing protein [unclassified Paenibacillus]
MTSIQSDVVEFLDILERGIVTSVYQPIICLSNSAAFGYEALTRGPEGSRFHSPLALFEYAEKNGYLYELDRLTREKALAGCGSLRSDQKLFINIQAGVIHDPNFMPGVTIKRLHEYGLQPHNVVFEITERSSIDDFSTTKQILQHYRHQGYQIAIDDAGAGYSSLQAIVELQPDFIKIDRSLIQNIHTDHVKQGLLDIFITFAGKMNIKLIAEGIELEDELTKLVRMGVHYGQGYLLGRPDPCLRPIREETKVHLDKQRKLQPAPEAAWTIGDLINGTVFFQADTPVSEVAVHFKQNPKDMGVVIVSGDIPAGLVMREKLFQQLAGLYGVPLYWNRPISNLMDASPLIVDEREPVEAVSQMAMSREIDKLYDFVVITSAGKMAGVATIRSILECISSIRMERAKTANPLTGLPGNSEIMRTMNRYLLGKEKFSVIYADLDFFKWYNDKHGFQRGDRLLQYTADVLLHSVTVCGAKEDFVGHVGGDDFIIISRCDDTEKLCLEIIRRFESGVADFYEEEIRFVEDRHGNSIDASGVSVSLAVIVCTEPHSNITSEQISVTAANLKKRAKSHIGSIYCKEEIK